MSKKIGSPSEPSIEVINLVPQLDEILHVPLIQEIDSLAKLILQAVEKNQHSKSAENIAYEKLAESIYTYSMRVMYCVETKTIEEAVVISDLSSTLLDDFRDKELPNGCKQALQSSIISIQEIAQGIVNDKKDPDELKRALALVKELLVVTEKNKPSRKISTPIVEVPTVTLDSREYDEFERLTKRHQTLKNYKAQSENRKASPGEGSIEKQFAENISRLFYLYDASESSAFDLIYQLLDADKESAPGIFDKLLEISCKQIQELNPYFQISEFCMEIAFSPRRDVAPKIVNVQIIDEFIDDFVTPVKNSEVADEIRLERILDFDTPVKKSNLKNETCLGVDVELIPPITEIKLDKEVGLKVYHDFSNPMKIEIKEKLPIDWLGDVEDCVMEYRQNASEDLKKSINEGLNKFLEALQETMFIDATFIANIQSLIRCEGNKFLSERQKLITKLFKYADNATVCSKQKSLNTITENDRRRLEGIIEAFDEILKVIEKCEKIDQEIIKTLKMMMEVVIEQFDTTKPIEKQIKQWLNNSMVYDKFWLRFKPEITKIKAEIKLLFPSTQTKELKTQEIPWAEKIED